MKRLLPLFLTVAPAFGAHDLRDAGEQHHVISALSAEAGQSLFFSHVVENAGTADAGKTRVTYWLSTDLVAGNAGDVNLGFLDLEQVLRSRPEWVEKVSVIPASTAPGGGWKLLWSVDPAGDANPANNTGFYGKDITVTAPPSFDLQDAGAAFRSLSATTLTPGQSFQAGATVSNAGPAAAPGFSIQFRLSTDTIIGDADDVVLGTASSAGLAAPGGHASSSRALSRSLSLPSGQAAGSYRFGYTIVAPGDAAAANNAVLFSQTITVPPPPAGTVDLVDAGSSFHSLPWFAQVEHGSPVTVGGAIRNVGTVTSGSFNLFFFVSTDNTVGNADDLIIPGPHAMGPVLPNVNGLQLGSFSVPVPTTLLTPGQSYRFGWTITGGGDGNTANNATLNPVPVLIFPRPDVELLPGWTVGGELNAGGNARIQFVGNVRNNSASMRRFRISPAFQRLRNDGSADPNPVWMPLGNGWNHPVPWGLRDYASGEPRSEAAWHSVPAMQTATLVLGSENGSFGALYDSTTAGDLGFFVDLYGINPGRYRVSLHLHDESGTLLDSLDVPQPVEILSPTRPDLGLHSAAAEWDLPMAEQTILSTGAVAPGGSLTVRRMVWKNDGVENAPAAQARVYANGTAIGPVFAVPALTRHASSAETDLTVTVPAGFPAGPAEISVRIDPANAIAEGAEQNNEYVVGHVLIGPQPDLRERGASFRSLPGAAAPGVQSSVQFQVRNAGAGNAGAFTVRLFHSDTLPTESAPGTLLAEAQVNSLAALSSQALTLFFTLPSGTPEGQRHLSCRVDAGGQVAEAVETNNWSLLGTVFCGTRPNLRPVDFAISTDEVTTAQSFTLTGARLNDGNLAAGAHRISFIFRSGTEERRYIESVGSLAAGGRTSFSYNSSASGLFVGVWTVGCLVDSFGQVEEGNEYDNIVWFDQPLHVIAPIVPGQPPPPPAMLEVERYKNDIRLRWTSRKGLTYQPEWSINGVQWRDLGPALEGTTGSMSQWFLDAAGTSEPVKLFRTRQE